MINNMRLGFVLSIIHHMLLLPALVITGWGLVMLLDDRINLTLLFMNKPNGPDVSFYWSLGWGTVFSQVTRNVPNGSTYIGINLFAFACATVLWIGMDETDVEDDEEYEMEMRRRERQARRPPLTLPPTATAAHASPAGRAATATHATGRRAETAALLNPLPGAPPHHPTDRSLQCFLCPRC